jgi:hypothetical protein
MSERNETVKQTYVTTITQEEGMNATGLPVPAEVVAAFGKGKKPKVTVTVNGHTYRSTVAAYGDIFMLPLSQENRKAAGVRAGDRVEVTLELDLEPRLVEIPPDLEAALSEQPGLRAAFDALSYTMRKEYVRQVEDARAIETRKRRIAAIVGKLSGEGA